jgi:glycosyltransferase involved in cell wall biosynthesis
MTLELPGSEGAAMIAVVILTFNEERHLARAMASVEAFADQIYVIDSGSSDSTVEIARSLGAHVLVNPFVTQAQQFNWALDQLPRETQWVLRLDADEIVTPPLAEEISAQVPDFSPDIDGVFVSRCMTFMGRPIRYGGVFPIRILRLFRYGRGRCENRWMDEHILVDGGTAELRGEILDDNRHSLSWWTNKHNNYASREVVELLNLEHRFMSSDATKILGGGQVGRKRWLKERVYARLPGGLRAFVYFLYRYVARGGFLDGYEGTAFHFLQGFWYRYLVDAKLHEVRCHMRTRDVDAVTAIKEMLGINVRIER